MSFIPRESLTGRNLIAQFIIESRPKGAILPYSEYQFIEQWLKIGNDNDLLLILDELLPRLYKDGKERAYPPSLARINKQVCTRLMGIQKRQNF